MAAELSLVQPSKEIRIFQDYVILRTEMKVLEEREHIIKPAVINAALNIYAAGCADKKTVYKSKAGKISLVVRKVIPKNNKDLQNLEELIQLESEKAKRKNNTEIAVIEEEIKRLNDKLESISQTDYGRQLIAEFEELKEQSVYEEPTVAFRLK